MRVELTPEEVPVGEAITLRVTVLGPTFFPKPPQFPSFELANLITRLPPNSSRPTTERVDGETWSGVTRRYQLYPLVGAGYELTDQTVAVTYAAPGSIRGTTVEVDIPDIKFRAFVPEGAESLDPYVAGRALTIERSLEGDTVALEAGDALSVTYVAELDGLPAMFLPALVHPDETPGVSVYADQPVIEDGPPARRTERYTLVFEAGGDFVIPGASVAWWNSETGRIEPATVPPMTVSVVGQPVSAVEETPPDEPTDWRTAVVALALLFVVWKVLARLTPVLRARREAAHERYLHSETYAFQQLETALLGNDRRRAQAALLEWLSRIAPGMSPSEFAAAYGKDDLQEPLQQMSRTLYRDDVDDIATRRLAKPLFKARRRALEARDADVTSALPPLNP